MVGLCCFVYRIFSLEEPQVVNQLLNVVLFREGLEATELHALCQLVGPSSHHNLREFLLERLVGREPAEGDLPEAVERAHLLQVVIHRFLEVTVLRALDVGLLELREVVVLLALSALKRRALLLEVLFHTLFNELVGV